MQIVMGIDPGINKTGWSILSGNRSNVWYVASGVIATSASNSIAQRLGYMSYELDKLIILHKPTIVSIEDTFVNMNAQSSLILAQARGLIIGTVGRHDLDVVEYKPNAIKKTVTGYGHASKEQIITMLKFIFPSIMSKSPDQNDAISVAYTYIMHN